MAQADDLFIGQEAVQRKLITREQLQDALFEMFEQERISGGDRWPLGVILVSSGYIMEAVLLSLLAERVQPAKHDLTRSQEDDLDFGRLLVLSGALEPDQVNKALDMQQRLWVPGRPSPRLGEIIVEMGMATPEHIQRVLSYQRAAVMSCTACGRRYHATKATPHATLRCPRCGGGLRRAQSLEFDESIRLTEEPHRPRRPVAVPAARAPVGEQAQIDRALALYVRQNALATDEAIHEAQRLQLEISRYGIELALLDVMKRLGTLTPRQASEIERMNFSSIVQGPGWARQTVPGYRITRRIAAGGSSTIFAAEPLFGGADTVAIKILHPDRARDATAAARFRREAELLCHFEHPGIVKGIETGVVPPPKPGAPELHYLTMEYLDADALDHFIAIRGGISPRHAIRITAQIAHALMYMAREKCLHRDVKPENILVDAEWQARLCDLGLAAEDVAVRGGSALTTAGTATYMSPEQASGATDLDPATDIYALGMTLYAMLTGRPPFTGSTPDEILQKRFEGGRSGAPDLEVLPAAPMVRGILRRMLEPDRTLRINGYPELLEALKQACP